MLYYTLILLKVIIGGIWFVSVLLIYLTAQPTPGDLAYHSVFQFIVQGRNKVVRNASLFASLCGYWCYCSNGWPTKPPSTTLEERGGAD